MEYYSGIKKRNNAICSNVEGPGDYHTKKYAGEKTNIIWYQLYAESTADNEFSSKIEIEVYRLREWIYGLLAKVDGQTGSLGLTYTHCYV